METYGLFEETIGSRKSEDRQYNDEKKKKQKDKRPAKHFIKQ